MMKRIVLMVAVAAAASFSAAAADRIAPAPGLWEQSTALSADGKTWRPGRRTQGCLTEAQASDWDAQMRRQVAQASCTIDTLTVGGGRISGVIACATLNQPVVTLSGDYTDTAYDVNLVSAAVVDASQVGGPARAPVRMFARWTGRRVGPC